MKDVFVPTGTGLVAVEALGFTLMHEHVVIFSAGTAQGFPFLYDRDAICDAAVRSLVEARRVGVTTIVDVTTVDLGRDPELVAAAANEAGVNVVFATGIWLDVPRYFAVRDPNAARDVFLRELEEGMGGTSIRAGIIKVASHEEVTPAQEIVLRGAARASLATGVAITTHTLPSARTGLRQLEVLAEEGVPADRVIIGHSSCSDLEYLELLYASGCTVGWDQFGTSEVEDEPGVIDALAHFLARGHAAQTVLSQDYGAFVDWDFALTHSFGYVSEVVLPALRAKGIADEAIRTMTEEAPARLLARIDPSGTGTGTAAGRLPGSAGAGS